MLTNIIPEIVALPFALTLYFFMLVRYRNQSRKDVSFRHNLLVVSISIIIDILTCIFTDTGIVSENIIIGIHTFSLISYAFIPFFFILYIYDYSDNVNKRSRPVMTAVSYLVFAAVAVTFLQNLINENIFGTDENGRFFRSSLYPVFEFGARCIFGIYALISTIFFRKSIRRSQFIVIIFSFVIVGISIILQLTVFSNYNVILAGVTIGLYEMFLSHETPEYYELAETLKDLEKSREEEKQAKLKAIAADDAKTQFLTQMSHEIRTPINAIMGYNNIIMEDTLEDTTREYSRKARLASRRLIDFFDSLFEYIDIGGEAAIKEITRSEDSEELQEDDLSAESTGIFSGAQELRILVVDDTEMNVELLVRMLRSMGFETESAPDGEKALEYIYSTHYDLIFMDHMMPVMDGMEAMKKIREEKLCENTPVIMLTANTIKGEKEKYLEAGFAEYITKPFSVASIKEVVLKYLPVDEELINQSSWPCEWRQLQRELPFLRLSSSMEYFMADADFFIKAVTLFAKSTVVSKLEEYISSADYYNYRAVLCSIKDSSRMIGADMLSERTSIIEKLYIRGDIDELKKKHVAFIDSIQKLIKQLSSALYISDTEIDTNAISNQTDTRPLILLLSGDDEMSSNIL
ncbi:MAG: response regulator, partial [Ruminiclostridium sp.]|nr:response regulator [Ruminiclostridium sp.]